MTTPYTCLQFEIVDSVATVTLNRPEVRNAFNDILIQELTHCFEYMSKAAEIGVIVLAAKGKSFCAGADLAWMKSMANYSHEENLSDARRLAQMLKTMHQTPIPIIAKLQGDAYAGGIGLVAVCDIVVACEDVYFCLSEARLGLIPATIGPYVIKAMGFNASRRYFVSAERFDASKALEMGLVHELCSSIELDRRVDQIASGILQNGPQAVRACKKLVKDYSYEPFSDVLIEDSVQRIAKIRCSEEAQSRMKSFLEKK